MQRTPIRGRLDRDDEGRMAAPTAPGAFTGALAADIGVIDLDPRPGGAQLVAAVAFDHACISLCWTRQAALVEIPSRRPSSILDSPFLPWASRCMARNHTRIGNLVP